MTYLYCSSRLRLVARPLWFTACFYGVLLVLFSLMAHGQSSATPATRFVSTTGTNNSPATATSWATSTTDLQGAINASASGDQVWVAAGVYKPTTTTGPASRTISFSMANNVTIVGGFLGHETSLNQRPAINPVIGQSSSSTLSGEIGDPNSTTDNSQHIIYNPKSLSLNNLAVLDGFVITGGYADTGNRDIFIYPGDLGGGVYNDGNRSICSPTFRNCSFLQNKAYIEGGAMFNDGIKGNSSPIVANCAFQSNSGRQGGAISNTADEFGVSSPVLTNCSFLSNSATFFGGAIDNDSGYKGNANPLLINVSFQNNTSPKGGALHNDGSYLQLTNCSFQNNTSANGGAMYNENGFYGPSAPVLTNCVLFGNGGSNTFFNKTDIGGSATYSLFEPTVTGIDLSGPGNLTNVTTSPFASTTSVALSTCSPAINAGLNSANASPIDLASQPRIVGGILDMGALEFQGTPFVAITTQPPTSLASCLGGIVTASVSTSGTVTSYQWYKNNALLPTQTTATLSLTNLQTTDAGSYSLVVTGACTSVTSTAFSLTVKPATAINPTVSISGPCSATSITLKAVGGSSYGFDGPGILSQTDGRERIIVGNYLLTRTNLPLTGIAVVNLPGTYIVVITDDNGCSVSRAIVVTSIGCNP